jgi:hypothetical protein
MGIAMRDGGYSEREVNPRVNVNQQAAGIQFDGWDVAA